MDFPYATVVLSPAELKARRRYAGTWTIIRDMGFLWPANRERWWDMVYYGRRVLGRHTEKDRAKAGGGYNGGTWRLVRDGELVFVVESATGEIKGLFLDEEPYPDPGPPEKLIAHT